MGEDNSENTEQPSTIDEDVQSDVIPGNIQYSIQWSKEEQLYFDFVLKMKWFF